MGPASHFLVGALCGAALGGIAVVLRRRLALYLAPFIIVCGFWGEAPYLLGSPDAAPPLANLFFGYAWLHPWLSGHDTIAFFAVVLTLNLLLLGYAVYIAWVYGALDTIVWEREGPPRPRRRPRRRRSSRRRSRSHRREE